MLEGPYKAEINYTDMHIHTHTVERWGLIRHVNPTAQEWALFSRTESGTLSESCTDEPKFHNAGTLTTSIKTAVLRVRDCLRRDWIVQIQWMRADTFDADYRTRTRVRGFFRAVRSIAIRRASRGTTQTSRCRRLPCRDGHN
jgi:hypothetical protein